MFDFQKTKSVVTTPVVTIIITLGLISPLGFSAAQAEGLNGNIRLFAGVKHLDKDDWQSMDSQGELGLLMDFKMPEWPVSIAVNLLIAGTDSDDSNLVEESGYTAEIQLGARKIWGMQFADIHPYVGGGIALIGGGFELRDSSDNSMEDDHSVGTWIGTGAYWNITSSFNVGLDVRYSSAEVTVLEEDIDIGGMHAGLTLGFNF